MEIEQLLSQITALEQSKREFIAKTDQKVKSLEKQILELKKEKYQAGKFDYSVIFRIPKRKWKAYLESLSIEQLQYIICDRFGPDATYPLRHWQLSIYSRTQCRGDITWFELTDEEYKKLLCIYIERNL